MTHSEKDLVAVLVLLADSMNSTDSADRTHTTDATDATQKPQSTHPMHAGQALLDTLDLLVESSTRFTSAAEAGVLIADSTGNLHVAATSSERGLDIEEAQLGRDEGPCLDAIRSSHSIAVPDIAASRHLWPKFASIATDRGFRSAHAIPLQLRGNTIGGLNLFSTELGPFSTDDVALLDAMAQMATIGVVYRQAAVENTLLNSQLHTALDSRVVIEQAKGVLADRHSVEVDVAFRMLRDHARRTGAKLHDVAERVVQHRVEI